MNRRGGIFDILLIAVLTFIVAIIIYAALFVVNNFNGSLQVAIASAPETSILNLTMPYNDVVAPVVDATQQLRWWGIAIFFAFFLYVVLSNFFTNNHPVFFAVYVLASIITIIISIFLQYSYNNFFDEGLLGQTAQATGAFHIFMSNLTLWIIITAFVGGIALYINTRRNDAIY